MPVTTTEESSCPSTCPHLQSGGCYAKSGPVSWHWKKVSNGLRGGSWSDLTDFVSKLDKGQLWRHNQAGDLPGDNKTLDGDACEQLTKANHNKNGFTYTHYNPNTNGNGVIIKAMNRAGFVVNLSGNNPQHAIELANKNVGPVVSVATSDTSGTFKKAGKQFVQCPATMDNVEIDCATCKLCAVSNRKSIVYFPAHGTSKKKVNDNIKREVK